MHDNNYYAVLIGANLYTDPGLTKLDYAINDCLELEKILSSDICFFPPENITVIKSEDVNTRHIKETLFSIVHERRQEDTVLIYYSGHGFFGGVDEEPYLGTYDVDIDYLKKNPDEGISMNFLQEQIFLRANVKNIILIIDCCYSGAFLFKSVNNSFYDKNKVKTNRFVILSTTAKDFSYPDNNMKQSEFTAALIEGLKGGEDFETVDSRTGDVTVSKLIDYLQKKMHEKPTTFISGTKMVISNPGLKKGSHDGNMDLQNLQASLLKPLIHPFDATLDFVKSIIEFIYYDVHTVSTLDENFYNLLEIIRKIFDADVTVFWNREDQKKIMSDFSTRIQSSDTCDKKVFTNFKFINNLGNVFTRKSHGFKYQDSDNHGRINVIIPLDLACNEFLLILGTSDDCPYLEDQFAFILSHILSEIEETKNAGQSLSKIKLEAEILDQLKTIYGYLPSTIYDYRLGLFTKKLETVQMWFQPIVKLHSQSRYIAIDGYEALARDPKTQKVPNDLINAAELWGDDFQLLLDIYCFTHAVERFSELTRPVKSVHVIPNNLELSINVFPASLVQADYFETVNDIILKKDLFPGENLVLEISEKRDIPTFNHCANSISQYEEYSKYLNSFVNQFGVNFGIDDFGIGHSSISRISNLSLSHIKLDSDIPKQEHSELTMEYVVKMVHEKILAHSKVILEGVSNFDLITKYKLNKLKIFYIQGYAVSFVSPNLIELDEDLKEKLSNYYKVKG